MNMMVPNPVPAPAPLKTLSDTGLSMVMMRDVLLSLADRIVLLERTHPPRHSP